MNTTTYAIFCHEDGCTYGYVANDYTGKCLMRLRLHYQKHGYGKAESIKLAKFGVDKILHRRRGYETTIINKWSVKSIKRLSTRGWPKRQLI